MRPSSSALAGNADLVEASRPAAAYLARTRCRWVRTVAGAMRSRSPTSSLRSVPSQDLLLPQGRGHPSAEVAAPGAHAADGVGSDACGPGDSVNLGSVSANPNAVRTLAEGQQRLVRLAPLVRRGHHRKPKNWNICRKKAAMGGSSWAAGVGVNVVVVDIVEAVCWPVTDRPAKRMDHALETCVERLRDHLRRRRTLGDSGSEVVASVDSSANRTARGVEDVIADVSQLIFAESLL